MAEPGHFKYTDDEDAAYRQHLKNTGFQGGPSMRRDFIEGFRAGLEHAATLLGIAISTQLDPERRE